MGIEGADFVGHRVNISHSGKVIRTKKARVCGLVNVPGGMWLVWGIIYKNIIISKNLMKKY